MNSPLFFNDKRAAIVREKLEKEKDPSVKLTHTLDLALELLRGGHTGEALNVFSALDQFITRNNVPMPPDTRKYVYSNFAIAFMRHGEIQNCVENHNHESCIIPIAGDGIHQATMGSENAVKQYEAIQAAFPDDLESKYLMNLAYMTLGKFPREVPKKYLVNPGWFANSYKITHFDDIAPKLGLNRRGHAGGSVIDDFNNDGWLDIVITSWGPTDPLLLYINNGNGTFSDQTQAYGLAGQVASLHLNKADYNNDGYVDLFIMRGAWYQKNGDVQSTLMMNTGKGHFEDVTMQSGLHHMAASQAAAWSDYNLDGWVDLVIANESQSGYDRGFELYINQQDGTFRQEAQKWGLTKNSFYKGCTATYANDDKYPDVYFSSLMEGNFLYINTDDGQGGRKFVPAQTSTSLNAPLRSFPCWTFDVNNDGNEDLFVSSYDNWITPVNYWMQSKMNQVDPGILPKLYLNKGNMQYEEVGRKMGLHEVAFTMGCNYGDINTDGYPDFYLATGNPAYQSLVPNKMYLNIDGQRFEDVSYIGGFANIQKGHGVSFGDLDHDGDEDIYVVMGGAFDGDFFFNMLFENPNEKNNHWVVLSLEGTEANRSAIGARVMVSVQENGKERKIYNTVSNGASFGGNSFALEVGLRQATSINRIHVQWPCKDCPDQEFTGLQINKAYKLIQGNPTPQVLPYTAVKMGGGSSQALSGQDNTH